MTNRRVQPAAGPGHRHASLSLPGATTPSVISIIIPTYNEGRQPLALVESLAGLPGLGEIIIVDSSDDDLSGGILRDIRDGGRARVVPARARGRAAQMNQGAEMAAFEILLFLHCDTRLPADAVSRVEHVLGHRRWGRFDLRLDHPGWRFRLIGCMINLRSRLTRIATGDQAIFTRKDFFVAQGGFAGIALMEDIEFSRRAGRRSRPGLVTSPVTTSARRWISHGTVRTILLMWKLRLLYRLGADPDRLAAMYRTGR